MIKSLKAKFSLFIALTLILSIGMLTFISRQSTTKAITQKVNDSTKSLNVAIQEQIEGLLGRSVGVLMTLSETSEVKNLDKSQMVALFAAMHKGNGQLVNVYFGDAVGNMLVYPVADLPEGFDARQRDWYKDAQKNGNITYSDVYIDTASKQPVVTISYPVQDGQGQFQGVLGVDVSLQTLSELVNKQKIGQTGYVFVTDRQGKVIAHPDQKLVRESYDLAKEEYVKKALAGGSGFTNYIYKGEQRLVNYSQIPSTGWGLFVNQTELEAYAVVDDIKRQSLLLSLVILALAMAGGIYAATRFLKTITSIQQGAQLVAQGDLTYHIPVQGQDELAHLTSSINEMTEHLKSIITQVKGSATAVADTCVGLAEGAEQTAGAASKTTQEITDVAATIEEISASAEEVSAAAQEASSSAQLGRVKIDEVINDIQAISHSSADAMQAVSEVDNKAQEVGKIVDLITQIADQTNLLALNAAIEAARAGEQGRGFAVVADEVRKLAERTGSATKDIAQLISTMQTSTQLAVLKMQEGGTLVQQGSHTASESGNVFSRIEEIIMNLSAQIDQTATGTQGVAASIQNVAAVSQEQTAIMQEVNASVERLKGMAMELDQLVNRFKVE